MGGVVKSVTGAVGSVVDGVTGGLKPRTPGAATIEKQPFNVGKESKKAGKQVKSEQKDLASRQRFATKKQRALIKDLSRQAAGKGPSLAEAQLKSATNRNLAQQMAAAASMRGGAGTQRQLLRQQGEAGRQLAEQAAQARMQEQQAARQQLGGLVAQEQAATDAATQNYIKMGYDLATAQKRANQERALAQAGMQQQANQAGAAAQNQMTGALLGGASQLGAAALMSDKTLKKDVKDGKHETSKFLEALSSKSFKYKPNKVNAKGTRIGIMAQDLEKSKAGKQMVEDTPYGKAINPSKGFGAALAAMADIHQRLKKVEEKNGKS